VKGRIGRVSPMKSKVTGKSDSHKSRWVSMSERVSNQPGDIVLTPRSISQYNPVTGQVVKDSDTAPVFIEKSIGKPAVVKEKPDVVKEKPAVVKEKPTVVKEKLDVVKEKPAVLKDKRKTEKNSKALDNPKESDKAADVIESDKAADVIESDKHKADVVKPSNVVADKVINVVADKVDVAKDKINVQDDPAKVVKESVLAVVKNKPVKDGKNSAPDALFQKDKALNVVSNDKPKGNALSELSKKKDKANIPKDKHKVHSEVPVLRSKPEVKAKSSVCEDVKRKRTLSKEDHSKKKPEVDYDSSSGEVSDRKPKKEDTEFDQLHVLFQKAKEKLATICSERVFLEDLLMKARSVYPRGEMDDDVRGDGDGYGDDDGNGDDDGRGDSDVNQ
nr:hypothetical protein [Tanacetum cinerariifolium]